MPFADVGAITYPARARERYANDLLARPRRRGDPRARLPDRRRLRLLGRQLRAAARARPARRRGGDGACVRVGLRAPAGAARARRSTARRGSSPAVDADFGAVFDRSAERIYLIDEGGREVPARPGAAPLPAPDRARTAAAASVAVPINATSQVEELVGDRLEVVRTPASLPELTRAAAEDGVDLRRAPRRRVRLPGLPAGLRRDGVALQAARAARDRRSAPLSELVARAAAPDAHPPPGAVPVGAQGHRHARAQRAVRRRATSTCATGSRSSTSAAGCRCCPTRTSRSSTSTPRARRREASEELESEIRGSSPT